MFILTPAAAIFLIARELIVSLLYSSEFHAIIPYITWAIVGTVFRAYSWCLAVTIIAKGDGRTFLFTETTSVVTGFVLNVTFYNLWGLDGLGFAYMTWYAAYCVITGFVYFRRYRYTLSHGSGRLPHRQRLFCKQGRCNFSRRSCSRFFSDMHGWILVKIGHLDPK